MQKKMVDEMNMKVESAEQKVETMHCHIKEKEQNRKTAKVEEVTKNFSNEPDNSDSEQEDEWVNYRAICCGGWMTLI